MIIHYHLLCEEDGGLVVKVGVGIPPGLSNFSEQNILATFAPSPKSK